MSQPQPEVDLDAEEWARLLQEVLEERDREWWAMTHDRVDDE
ncbi:hypothetical protein [Nocardioides okcheonensis]|nr:hypothetical protein [Nocardioides okcheonensis]